MRYFFSFLLRYHFFFLFLLLEVICFLLMVESNQYQHTRVINGVSEMTGSVQARVNAVTQYLHLKEANKALAEENARLRSQLLSSYLLVDTNTFRVEDTAKHQQYSYINAQVISNTVNTRNNYLMLNKGSKHGIQPDMAVISPEGIVGIVSKVSENFSWVISLLHKQTKISARIKKNGFVGTISWKGTDYSVGQLMDIPANVLISKGDTVVTSGFSHIFPPNLMIGTIQSFQVDKGYNFYDITLKFSQNYKRVSHVYVIRDFFSDEKMDLEKFKVDE